MMSFEQFLEANRLNSPWDLYDYFFNQIKDKAYQVGIDLSINTISVDSQRKYTGSKIPVVDASLKSKVAIFVKIDSKKVAEGKFANFPTITFYSNKDSESVYFSTYSAAWELYKAAKPVNRNDKPQSTAPAAPVFKPKLDDGQWKESQVSEWSKQYEAGSQSVADSLYLKSKFSAFGVAVVESPAANFFVTRYQPNNHLEAAALACQAAGIRRVTDSRGECLLVPLHDGKGQLKGFQKIYDVPVNFAKSGAEPEFRNKDYRFYQDGKKGAFIRIGTAAKCDDYVFVAEGLATALTVHLATGKAVFAAMDAGNLSAVLKAVKDLGFKRPVIAADNDCGKGGNAGVYSALKAAKAHGARIFVPVFENRKVDFNDLLSLADLGAVKKQLVFRNNANEITPKRNVFEGALQLLEVCPNNQLRKHAWICAATAVSNQFLMDLSEAKGLIRAVLQSRGDKTDTEYLMSAALTKAMGRTKEKNAARFDGFKRVVDCTSLSNEAIAADIMQHKGIWLDNRPMGTGKTELMGYVLGLVANKDLTSSYICHRQSLVANSSERIKAVSYKLIQSKSDVMYENAIALCVNSIINPRFYDYAIHSNVIFIDEIRQTLEHVAIGSINSNERKQVYDALIFAIKQADIVLGSDADLNQLTVDWLKHNFPDKDFYGLTCERVKPKATIFYSGYESAFNAAIESARAGKKTLIQCDSIKAAKAVFEAVNRPHLKVLVLHSQNKDDPEQALFLLNPNDEILKYDTVIHSPVIGTGVSITCSHVEGHFALFRGVLAENEVLQMIGRNRPSLSIVVGFNDKHVRNRVNSAKTLFDGEAQGRTRVIDGVLDIDALDRLRMRITSRHNDSLNDVETQALLLMRVKGYAVERFVGNESVVELQEARVKARAVHCEGVTSAAVISVRDAYKLEKAESITQEQSYQLERFNITHEFALPSTLPVDSDDVVFYDAGRVVKTIHNREIANATNEQRQAVDKKNGGFRSVAKGVHIDVVLSLLRDRTVDQYHAALILNYLNHNYAELAACGLGNYAKPSKYPVRAVNEFLERFGYKLEARKISSGVRKGDRVYVLGSDERIDEIVERRTLQNVFKSAAVADAD
jgi:hypothetical protein